MLDNRHEAVCSDGRTELFSDSVLDSTSEILNREVLHEPLEENSICHLFYRDRLFAWQLSPSLRSGT